MSPFSALQQRIAPSRFGRRQPFTYAMECSNDGRLSLADDARLFLTAFAGGLLFMTIYLG